MSESSIEAGEDTVDSSMQTVTNIPRPLKFPELGDIVMSVTTGQSLMIRFVPPKEGIPTARVFDVDPIFISASTLPEGTDLQKVQTSMNTFFRTYFDQNPDCTGREMYDAAMAHIMEQNYLPQRFVKPPVGEQ